VWWQFAFESEAPRSLRATLGVIVTAAAIALTWLFGPAPARPTLPSDEEVERARAIAVRSTNTYANLVLRRDKAILLGTEGRSFLAYGGFDRSWIAMGDPIGPAGAATELIWRFRELCDHYDRWPLFFEVGSAYREVYLDMGLDLLKLGEEARVPLPTFSLEQPAHGELRRTRSRLLRGGCEFEIIPVERVAGIAAELRRVSDLWLAEKATREKGFSNASFSEHYVALFPAAVVRSGGRIVAFANLWLGAEREELSVDLMRFEPSAPSGAMDLLFTEVMVWGKAQGYRWFNLGMAPLSGMDSDRSSPLWGRLATFVFRHGEHFYNFRGLRHYKAKFQPHWEARFLASPGGLALPRILLDVTALVAGGIGGIVAK
jgi:phosphatidylglycerol lysyltransferase